MKMNGYESFSLRLYHFLMCLLCLVLIFLRIICYNLIAFSLLFQNPTPMDTTYAKHRLTKHQPTANP